MIALPPPAAAPLPKGAALRAIASPAEPRASTLVGVAFAGADYLLFYGGAALFVAAPSWGLKALGVAVSGVAAAMLFALAHDAAHGSLAGSRRANRLLATVCFFPSWYPFTPWIRGHNHLHHGWTNVGECDYSWRPVSPDDYRAMPAWRRGVERVYRSWWGLWAHSIVEIWWKHMAMPRESDRRFLNARHLLADRVLVATVVGAHVAACWWRGPEWSTAAGGAALSPWAVVAGVVVLPWWIFHVMFSVVTFLHHTHPRVPWFRTRRESSFFAGQVKATVHVELPQWVELLLHNITVHGAHHVDPRIPFRHLPGAQRRIESAFASDVLVERWSLRSFVATTRTCQLYDYDAHQWRTFREAATLPCASLRIQSTLRGEGGEDERSTGADGRSHRMGGAARRARARAGRQDRGVRYHPGDGRREPDVDPARRRRPAGQLRPEPDDYLRPRDHVDQELSGGDRLRDGGHARHRRR